MTELNAKESAVREIHVKAVEDMVSNLCQEANTMLPDDVVAAIRQAAQSELSPMGQEVLEQILDNAAQAAQSQVSLCQDGGVTIVFMEIGQDIHFVGGSFEEAVHAGIRRGYQSAHLRGSVLSHPFHGQNSGFNTPGVLHSRIVLGSSLRITVLPKGGGADNMSQLKMLTPASGVQGVKEFVLDVVKAAGPNACPPLIVGVGVGGTFDSVGTLAKQALLREVGTPSPDSEIAALEQELLQEVNNLGIGPMGLGGTTTALAVHIETHPLHMAALPVAVNLQCHSARVKTFVL